MPRQYRRSLAPSLRAELIRLESGTKLEQQRSHNATNAILKVMANPISRDFSKNLPENYKAVDVLQQYRLFFKVIDAPLTQDSVVHFVWINAEDSLHRTGKPDDCYEVFRKMVECREIETYQPPQEPERKYILHGAWTTPVIYASYTKTLNNNVERADGHLHLSQISAKEYRIESISVSQENVGLASELLVRICGDADVAGITLTHDLFPKSSKADKTRSLLKKFNFQLLETIDDLELWVRPTPQ
ncbi:type II toxin-antitoxin system YhaV family toxin [Bdellovibrionota bacterium FG-1]